MRNWTVTGDETKGFWATRTLAQATISADCADGSGPVEQWRVIRVPVIDRSFPQTGVVQIEATILHTFDGDADEAADMLAEAMIRGARACREAMRAPLAPTRCDGPCLGCGVDKCDATERR